MRSQVSRIKCYKNYIYLIFKQKIKINQIGMWFAHGRLALAINQVLQSDPGAAQPLLVEGLVAGQSP
ncbi:hypothetical protein [Pseudomonas sp. TUM22785]|uniref:hypothetical protein n=1 Tax=Pseudomonas sp. TUM22785 TaxID=3019098 RepID=UPI002305FB0D|nr:hypothetical protein [Pseudomonas sp. TUM22785]WCD77905.1 hypothetical protein PI990_18005 [Pseudomonas sp. TUM22785]